MAPGAAHLRETSFSSRFFTEESPSPPLEMRSLCHSPSAFARQQLTPEKKKKNKRILMYLEIKTVSLAGR